jgi:WhiB family redox-sensing transcriptional regulator
MSFIPYDDTLDANSALCAQVDPELFFAGDGSRINGDYKAAYKHGLYAKSLCAQCELTVPCLLTAMVNREEYGIWGGASGKERRTLKTKKQALKFVDELRKRYAPTQTN